MQWAVDPLFRHRVGRQVVESIMSDGVRDPMRWVGLRSDDVSFAG